MFSKLHDRLKPYKAGEQPQDKKYIKLNTNENPYPPGVRVSEAAMDMRALNLYPDPECRALREALAGLHKVKPEEVFVGNGSDEVLSFCFGAFFSSNGSGEVLFPDITYSFYPVYCGFYDIPYREIPLDKDFNINLDEYSGKIQGVVIANPNAPTGIVLDKAKIISYAEKNPEVMIVADEAYADFSGQSLAGECAAYKNIVVVRTFSKAYSFAGIRVGYAIGNAAVITALNNLKNSFNSYTVSTFNQTLACAAIKDNGFYMSNVQKIIATRERFRAEIAAIGYASLPGGGNFLFVRCPRGGEYTYRYLKDNGILVRFFPGFRTDAFVRITIGTDQDMDKVVEALKKLG